MFILALIRLMTIERDRNRLLVRKSRSVTRPTRPSGRILLENIHTPYLSVTTASLSSLSRPMPLAEAHLWWRTAHIKRILSTSSSWSRMRLTLLEVGCPSAKLGLKRALKTGDARLRTFWIMISESVLLIQGGMTSLETHLECESSQDVSQDSIFSSKEEHGLRKYVRMRPGTQSYRRQE